jgi:hypothetical protein
VARNPEVKKACNVRWYERNREKVRLRQREYQRTYRALHPERVRAYVNKYHEANRDKTNAAQRLKRTGCTPEQYAQALIDQNNLCLICKQPFVDNKGLLMPCADHDHATMTFRGLLHQKCNRGLGHFNDDVTLLQAAIDYLNRTKGENE